MSDTPLVEVSDFDLWWNDHEIWPSEYTAAASAWIESREQGKKEIMSRIKEAADKVWTFGEYPNSFYTGPPEHVLEHFVMELIGYKPPPPAPMQRVTLKF